MRTLGAEMCWTLGHWQWINSTHAQTHSNAHTYKDLQVWHLNGSHVGNSFFFFQGLNIVLATVGD